MIKIVITQKPSTNLRKANASLAASFPFISLNEANFAAMLLLISSETNSHRQGAISFILYLRLGLQSCFIKFEKRLCSIGPCILADWLSIIAVISSPLSSFSIVRLSTKSLICNPGAGKSNVNTYFTQFLIKLNVSNLSSSPNG